MSAPSLGPPTPNIYGPMFGGGGNGNGGPLSFSTNTNGSNNNNAIGNNNASQQQQQQAQQQQQEEGKIYALVIDLMDANCRESALLELSKKREQYDDLALVLWHSFGEYFRYNLCLRVIVDF